MKVGIDIDGCLASFESGFAPILTTLSGIEFPVGDAAFPPVWEWPKHYGVSKTQENAAWKQVATDSGFWRSLAPMPGTGATLQRLSVLAASWEVYFITTRPGIQAKQQSEAWLQAHGYQGTPTVIVSGEKGLIAAGVGLDVFIDDKPSNLSDVRRTMGNRTRYYLVEHPYNRNCEERLFATMVSSVGEMLEEEQQ